MEKCPKGKDMSSCEVKISGATPLADDDLCAVCGGYMFNHQGGEYGIKLEYTIVDPLADPGGDNYSPSTPKYPSIDPSK